MDKAGAGPAVGVPVTDFQLELKIGADLDAGDIAEDQEHRLNPVVVAVGVEEADLDNAGRQPKASALLSRRVRVQIQPPLQLRAIRTGEGKPLTYNQHVGE